MPQSADDRCYFYKNINKIIILSIINIRLEGSNRTSLNSSGSVNKCRWQKFGGCYTSGYITWKEFPFHEIKDSQPSNGVSERKSDGTLGSSMFSSLNISCTTSALD